MIVRAVVLICSGIVCSVVFVRSRSLLCGSCLCFFVVVWVVSWGVLVVAVKCRSIRD